MVKVLVLAQVQLRLELLWRGIVFEAEAREWPDDADGEGSAAVAVVLVDVVDGVEVGAQVQVVDVHEYHGGPETKLRSLTCLIKSSAFKGRIHLDNTSQGVPFTHAFGFCFS